MAIGRPKFGLERFTMTANGQDTEPSSETATATARNVARLRVIMNLFRLEQADLVKASGYSKAFLSRLLNEKGFKASDRFWGRMNSHLPDLLHSTAGLVFEVVPTSHTSWADFK